MVSSRTRFDNGIERYNVSAGCPGVGVSMESSRGMVTADMVALYWFNAI